ncbi:MAG: 5-formyltetrahydrofolate cyclo-ligase [Acidobacteriota bacterium]|nr:5-formyltetrahydrofolate cyclo-ligase [Acidobacteriota bacterium]
MTSVAGRKRAMRARLTGAREGLGIPARAAADAAIETRLMGLPEFAHAEVILTYLDMGSEVRTRGIIQAAWDAGKDVALPRCAPASREMRWYRVTSLEGLVRSPFGVEEPVPRAECEQPLCGMGRMLALVPGLAFDVAGYRLGYGGGFYDRFLTAFVGVSVGLCREAQLSADLRAEGVVAAHDLPVRMVVTERRVIVA